MNITKKLLRRIDETRGNAFRSWNYDTHESVSFRSWQFWCRLEKLAIKIHGSQQ